MNNNRNNNGHNGFSVKTLYDIIQDADSKIADAATMILSNLTRCCQLPSCNKKIYVSKNVCGEWRIQDACRWAVFYIKLYAVSTTRLRDSQKYTKMLLSFLLRPTGRTWKIEEKPPAPRKKISLKTRKLFIIFCLGSYSSFVDHVSASGSTNHINLDLIESRCSSILHNTA